MKIIHLPNKFFRLRFKAPREIKSFSKKLFDNIGDVLHIDGNGIGSVRIKSKNIDTAKQYLQDLIGEEIEYV